ncbi:carboxysome shell protein [Ectothiorhodospiraceae bacterium BW-2]|nr:carboxysome shell protein [Ectothiorhodospiraceae bacterium BW-2]
MERRRALSTSGRTAATAQQNSASVTSTAAPARVQAAQCTGSARTASLARRKALSSRGKLAQRGGDRTRSVPAPPPAAVNETVAQPVAAKAPERASSARTRYIISPAVGGGSSTARQASRERRRALSTRGKSADRSADRTRDAASHRTATVAESSELTKATEPSCGCGGKSSHRPAASESRTPVRSSASRSKIKPKQPPVSATSSCRTIALARRQAQSTRGKAGISASGMTTAQTARVRNPQLTSRELAMAVREQQSRRGKVGQKKSEPTGKQRSSRQRAAASDATWKVGMSETARGQRLTGTMVDRTEKMTGNDESTCRTVTGTEYMGADIFRDFCQSDPPMSPSRSSVTSTSRGNQVTGNRVGRSQKVTGDEPGTCQKITGSEYLAAEQQVEYCGTEPVPAPTKITTSHTARGSRVSGNPETHARRVTGTETGANRRLSGTQYMPASDVELTVPAKVGSSQTLKGRGVTGTMLGRSTKMTGDESGSCRHVTGDDYIGQEQFTTFCDTVPAAGDEKVGTSVTPKGRPVTGTMTGRANQVTGDEPGTCQSITGTPYAGIEQYRDFCPPEASREVARRMPPQRPLGGASLTGLQPAVGDKMTGDSRGACEAISGTPYLGSEQIVQACAATAAAPDSPDFPQPLQPPAPLESATSLTDTAPPARTSAVTGAGYENSQITGPFGMAAGKVTGTEEARFGHTAAKPREAAPKQRVTGEGNASGRRITGDDWDRGERVTGTEGRSVLSRNPTRRGGPVSVMAPLQQNSCKEELAAPVSRVTGSSGNTDKGALVTYSGGARG